MVRPTFLVMPDHSYAAATTVTVSAEPIALSQLLKFSGLVESGGMAKLMINEGQVLLNGVVETQKAKKVMGGDRVTFEGKTIVVQVG